jgi:hypothetical protein
MRLIHISNSELPLPSDAIKIPIDLANESMLDTMTADHSPITRESIVETGLWMTERALYAIMPNLDGDQKYYRVMIGYI